ncbi:cleavage polyadenylation factor subunit YSH1 [Aspergillus puulaauensis]|uniref:Endoribonuclease YSH1 n=1 Tax=Aspergillus puulaauensis TaxID=1220207 RepID=A0A7R7XRK6_9EURO|nr:endoribonuclease ysh1 [Aspergillus puulaauensis]BCS26087.1 endoribonuclease ysh1 [Aspergillus puulaauensis]
MATKRKAAAMNAVDDEPVDPSDELAFYCLGGGNEVGRSCHIIQYKGKTVMLDAGMHPAKEGFSALPFFDEFDLSTVDILLISHFHVDHSSALPYVLSKTNFKGRVFMTHATKAIYKWLIQDNVRVNNTASSSDQRTTLYTEHDHLSTLPLIETIDFNTTHTINSIRITPFPAGHVLGAAMFLVSIAGLNTLFTGDYSREEDRHLIPAEVPRGIKIDVLITESTFGISSNPPRLEREAALMKSITGVLNRGGRVLMPVFALGRAQELLLILDEYWETHPELQKIPIYYIGNTARRCMVVYQTYIGAMNDNIKRLFRQRMAEAEASGDKSVSAGPWDFRFVRSLRSLERFDDVGGCVMLASPGMLQTGTSRELLERWAPNERNGVVMTGYSVEGTMAKQLLNEPDQIHAVMSRAATGMGRSRMNGNDEEQKIMIPRRCTVDEVSFAAHVDGVENRNFIEEVQAPVVILVHGEKHQMMRLKSKLLSLNADKTVKVKVYTPANCDEVRIPFRKDKIAKVVGKLAQTSLLSEQEEGPLMAGVLVQNGFDLSLMAPDDLREYAGLATTTITCKQHITLSSASMDLIKWALEGTFGAIEEIGTDQEAKNEEDQEDPDGDKQQTKQEAADEEIPMEEPQAYLVMGCVILRYHPRTREVELQWEGNMMNDGVADAVMAVLLTVESSPASVKQSAKHKHHHHHGDDDDTTLDILNPHAAQDAEERFTRLLMMLEAQFGSEIAPIERPRLASSSSNKDLSNGTATGPVKSEPEQTPSPFDTKDTEDQDPATVAELEAAELARLHALGIPVPGLEIKVDKHTARVWLEDLEVECANAVLRDRVRVVIERAVETVASMWSSGPSSAVANGGKGYTENTVSKGLKLEAKA